MSENIIAFLVARLSSSRLPNKHLKKIGNKRLIDWTIENVKKSKYVDKIVIATTNEKENRELIDIAKEHNIEIFLYDGYIDDVVGRLNKAAIKYKATIPILISGDCPLIWAESLDRLIKAIIADKELDHIIFCKKNEKTTIHEGMSVYRKRCWELADKISDKPNLREHQFPIVYIKNELFKTDCIDDDGLFYALKHRVSVDTLADLKFMNVIYSELKNNNKDFNMPNVVKLLIDKPYIININKDVHQIKIDEKQQKALFIAHSKNSLDTFFQMAYELTKKGVGVRFFVSGELKSAVGRKDLE